MPTVGTLIKNDNRKLLTIWIGCDCSISRYPPEAAGGGLAGGSIGCWAWWACDEAEDPCDIRGLDGLLGESLLVWKPLPNWRLAFRIHANSDAAFGLWIPTSTGRSLPSPVLEGPVLLFVSSPPGGLQTPSLRPRSRSTWMTFPLYRFLFSLLFFSWVFSLPWDSSQLVFL